MTRPIEYCREMIVAREMPYQIVGKTEEPESPLGWLEAGRIVWVRPTESARAAAKMSAYADGIGMVAVRKRYLAA